MRTIRICSIKKIFIIFISILISSNSSCLSKTFLKLEKKSNEEPKIEYVEQSAVETDEQAVVESSDELSKIIEEQKERDIKDLELLWKATVENNFTIEFALKKLAIPESQRRIQSSIMAKTLSAIVSGASFVPSLMGTNPTIQTSAFSAGRIAQGLINKKTMPQETPLTDTELIELAGMVEDLQDNLINSYYNYKNTLMQLRATRKKMLLYSKNFSNAIDEYDAVETTVLSSLYYSMVLKELTLEEEAKKYQVQLQRLAGKKAVAALELKQYDFDSIIYKESSVKEEAVIKEENKKND